ncbi:uncharacterized protein TRIVIDRAFT_61358 [Trichoderma virens Gv29-8]|uniref:Uncharacterized protein n=1 Tax=Hypocrea virens (strain Gv29-8 / FGSC 10586) TaxID=413071 RepID=G9MMK3_HYPVG|nr:uncharacterized protein TRIVIDRAFT_61358 [Trichoderma virens Gv29-8]EHK24571.1 hypothetical protein TRIVIDRAFT_61358 [Trichoderma virens Gv29-8]
MRRFCGAVPHPMYPIPSTLLASSYSVLRPRRCLRQLASGKTPRPRSIAVPCTGGATLGLHAAAVPVPHPGRWAGLCARAPQVLVPFRFPFRKYSVPATKSFAPANAGRRSFRAPPPSSGRHWPSWGGFDSGRAAIVAFSSICNPLRYLAFARSTFLAAGSHGGAPYRNRLWALTPAIDTSLYQPVALLYNSWAWGCWAGQTAQLTRRAKHWMDQNGTIRSQNRLLGCASSEHVSSGANAIFAPPAIQSWAPLSVDSGPRGT